MSKKTASKSPVRKGRMKKGGSGKFIKLGDGESVTFAFLHGTEEMLHADMHSFWDLPGKPFFPCLGTVDCPGCVAGNNTKTYGFMGVLGKDGEPRVWSFTPMVQAQVETLEDSLKEDGEELTGFVVKLSRKGLGLKTRYSLVGTGKRIDVSDFVDFEILDKVGILTKEEAEAKLNKATGENDDTDIW